MELFKNIIYSYCAISYIGIFIVTYFKVYKRREDFKKLAKETLKPYEPTINKIFEANGVKYTISDFILIIKLFTVLSILFAPVTIIFMITMNYTPAINKKFNPIKEENTKRMLEAPKSVEKRIIDVDFEEIE